MLATWGTSTGRNPTLDLQFAGATSLDNRITFSRGSQATLFDSTGALVYAKHNLLTYSQEFDNAAWTKQASVSVSPNTTAAPDGTTTADTVTADSGFGLFQSVTVTIGTRVTQSIYLRAGTATAVMFRDDTGAGRHIVVNPSTGVITSTSGTLIDSGSIAMGSGWFRIYFSYAADATSVRGLIRPDSAGAGQTFIVWGGQTNFYPMEGGVTSSLSTYYPTVASAYYAPRFDYNPSTLAAQGLLIEEQRTNSIRNNTMQGAVAGTPGTAPTNYTLTSGGGVTRNIVGVGTENGITYIDVQFSSAGANNFFITPEPATQIAAVSGQTWASSFYVRLIGGTLSNLAIDHNIQENSAAGAFLAATITGFTPTSASLVSQRNTITRTLNNASTAFVQSYIRGVASGAYDITLRIGLPQLEQGAFATSVIPTTTTALTRNADVASMTGTNFSSWYNQTEGSLFGQFSLLSSSYTGGVAIDIGAGGAFGATEYIAWNVTAWSLLPNAAPVNVSSSITTTSTAKVIAAIKANDSVISANGLLGPVDTSCAVPASATTLTIGKAGWSGGANYLNGYIQRISYYPVRLPNSTLQALTA